MASGYMADDDIHSEEFEFVLKELLSAFQPILEEDLKRAKAPEQLKKEAEAKPPSCEDEIALANRIFEKFVTSEVAVRLLPPQARELLGHVDRCQPTVQEVQRRDWSLFATPRQRPSSSRVPPAAGPISFRVESRSRPWTRAMPRLSCAPASSV